MQWCNIALHIRLLSGTVQAGKVIWTAASEYKCYVSNTEGCQVTEMLLYKWLVFIAGLSELTK